MQHGCSAILALDICACIGHTLHNIDMCTNNAQTCIPYLLPFGDRNEGVFDWNVRHMYLYMYMPSVNVYVWAYMRMYMDIFEALSSLCLNGAWN